MQIIAVSNIKGGVGKTTTAVNLSYLCAQGGRSTLLWDLDPQGAATYILRCDANERNSVKKLISGKRELLEVIVPGDHERLDVIPADFSYRHFDAHVSERKKPTERLLRMSQSVRQAYEVMFLDCPAGISLLSENILRAADVVLIPLIPTPLSVRMLEQLQSFVEANGWSDLVLLPFFSMVDRRKALHREVIDRARAQFPELLQTEVPYSSEIERVALRRAPLGSYSSASMPALTYVALWAEVEARLRRH